MTERYDSQRTSLYLVRQADALLGALRLFTVVNGNAKPRRLQFLAQSDFWEWEIDNLIYSFTTLAERQRTWSSTSATVAKLGQLGIAVDVKLLRAAKWRGHWKVQQAGTRVAPIDMLDQVVEAWNGLIDQLEAEFIEPMQEKVERWNVQSRKDLKGLRKQMPQIDLHDEETS